MLRLMGRSDFHILFECLEISGTSGGGGSLNEYPFTREEGCATWNFL